MIPLPHRLILSYTSLRLYIYQLFSPHLDLKGLHPSRVSPDGTLQMVGSAHVIPLGSELLHDGSGSESGSVTSMYTLNAADFDKMSLRSGGRGSVDRL